MRVDTQLDAWTFIRKREARLVDAVNGLGPFRQEGEDRYRHMDCSNYDGCLNFAAIKKWSSFSCQGCRKAPGPWVEIAVEAATPEEFSYASRLRADQGA